MSALRERMGAGASTIARAWVVRRADGMALGFTDHDRTLTVDGVACRPDSGLVGGALERSTGLSVDNGEAVGALSAEALTGEDLRAGRWDGAEVVHWLVDWSDPDTAEIAFRGTIGEVREGDGAFTAELRGLAEALNAPRGRVYHAGCDAVLGDARCGVDMAGPGMAVECSVLEGDARVLTLDGGGRWDEGWFARGRLVVLDGAAAGLEGRIREDRAEGDGRAVALWWGLGAAPAPGDRVRIEAGCDKTVGTCRLKFGNVASFRGFPHIPGEDWLMSYPSGRTPNDGGRR